MDLAKQCSNLQELQYRRKFYIKGVNRQMNAMRSLIQRNLGYSSQEGAASEKIKEIAQELLSKFMKGVVTDDPVIEAIRGDLSLMAATIPPMQKARDPIEKEMRKLAKGLPGYDFVQGVSGFGDLGFSVLVGEAGDLSKYDNPGKLWKRFGLAPYKGHALSTHMLKKTGLTDEDWVAAGYSKERRGQIHGVITDPLFRAQTQYKGPYRDRYDQRLARTRETHPEWYDEGRKMWGHRDALRIMTKDLIRDTWVAWREDLGLPVDAAAWKQA